MFIPWPGGGGESNQGQEEERARFRRGMQAERGSPRHWQRDSCLEAKMQEESSRFGLPRLGADTWPALQVPRLFSPSDSPSVKAAVHPRGLPCTHPLYPIHFSKCPLSPLPPHRTVPAAHWLHSAGVFILSSLTGSNRASQRGSHLPRAAQLTSSNWPSTNRTCPSSSPV